MPRQNTAIFVSVSRISGLHACYTELSAPGTAGKLFREPPTPYAPLWISRTSTTSRKEYRTYEISDNRHQEGYQVFSDAMKLNTEQLNCR